MKQIASLSSNQDKSDYIKGVYENWIAMTQITELIRRSISNQQLS